MKPPAVSLSATSDSTSRAERPPTGELPDVRVADAAGFVDAHVCGHVGVAVDVDLQQIAGAQAVFGRRDRSTGSPDAIDTLSQSGQQQRAQNVRERTSSSAPSSPRWEAAGTVCALSAATAFCKLSRHLIGRGRAHRIEVSNLRHRARLLDVLVERLRVTRIHQVLLDDRLRTIHTHRAVVNRLHQHERHAALMRLHHHEVADLRRRELRQVFQRQLLGATREGLGFVSDAARGERLLDLVRVCSGASALRTSSVMSEAFTVNTVT